MANETADFTQSEAWKTLMAGIFAAEKLTYGKYLAKYQLAAEMLKPVHPKSTYDSIENRTRDIRKQADILLAKYRETHRDEDSSIKPNPTTPKPSRSTAERAQTKSPSSSRASKGSPKDNSSQRVRQGRVSKRRSSVTANTPSRHIDHVQTPSPVTIEQAIDAPSSSGEYGSMNFTSQEMDAFFHLDMAIA